MDSPASADNRDRRRDLPVVWSDRSRRRFYVSEYRTVGSLPGIIANTPAAGRAVPVELVKLLSQRQILLRRRDKTSSTEESVRFVCSVLTKTLQRGHVPLPTLGIECAALEEHGLLELSDDLSERGVEMGWVLNHRGQQKLNLQGMIPILAERNPFVMDSEFKHEAGGNMPLFDSRAEERFISHWVPNALGESAAHWFTPQASLDHLAARDGADLDSDRRVDFLFYFPGDRPLVIEIDGDEHEAAQHVDEARDAQLNEAGIRVFRVPNEEVWEGDGPGLAEIQAVCSKILGSQSSAGDDLITIARVARDCSFATSVQFAIVKALQNGWVLPDTDWVIKLEGAGKTAVHGIVDILRMFESADMLYGGVTTPCQCTIHSDDDSPFSWSRNGEAVRDVMGKSSDKYDLHIQVESGASPFHAASGDDAPDVIIRPAYLPVRFASPHEMDFPRRSIQASAYKVAQQGLRFFLQSIFRKCDFRSMQGEAVHNTLCHNDCVVLLPTGAGKSIIYQLAGLLQPGITLVIDPLVSLIEDQVEGLARYGIDHVAPISSQDSVRGSQQELLRRVERGEYYFILVSPERLQIPGFRDALQALARKTFVNLAVIDEAHCVSEWGHDFRPAYLHLPNNLRKFCRKDDRESPPPLLALTGTASRVVLRDMLRELNIDQNSANALIRPETFDRPELYFEIDRVHAGDSPEAALRGVLNVLPEKLGLPRQEIFAPYGRDTASGIIFVPTVKGWPYGIINAFKIVKGVVGASKVTTYSGGPPWNISKGKWDIEKRENARKFKNNEVCVLVATNAFGMGIDKPNIRYTVHFGMPRSLENFYQEVGRAGRDQQPACCIVVFSEQDPVRSDQMLDPRMNLEDLRQRHDDWSNTGVRDDVISALWFHLQGFRGVESEIKAIEGVLRKIGEYSAHSRVSIPFRKDKDQKDKKDKEKAILRLVILGVIQGYETEFGSGKFNLVMHDFDAKSHKEKLHDYIQKAQPAKSILYREEIDQVVPGDSTGTILWLARILVGFTYETIERSRRRMVQEAMLFARQSKGNSDIRKRLLDYLQEGLGAENIYELAEVEADKIDFALWFELLEKSQSPLEASELRGILIRSLESYPDHPGLLLTRAIVESMCTDYDYGACRSDLISAIQKIIDYGLGDQLATVIRKVHELARDKDLEELSGMLVLLLCIVREETRNFPLDGGGIIAIAEEFGNANANVRLAILACKLRDLTCLLEESCARLSAPLPPPLNKEIR